MADSEHSLAPAGAAAQTPMEDPFPSLGSEPAASGAGAARDKRGESKPARPDVASEDAFPTLGGGGGAARAGPGAPRAPGTWVSNVPVIQRVMRQTTVTLQLTDEQLLKLSDLLQRVRRKCPGVSIEASTTRRTGSTTFIIKGASDAAVQQAKKELSVALARRVSLSVMVPRSLRAHVIGTQGKNVRAITEQTGVRIQLPPRGDDTDEPPVADPLLEPHVEIKVEGDEVNARQAQAMIESIVAERTSKITQRLTDIDHVYYPFIAGAHNARLGTLTGNVGRGEVSVNVPPRGALISAHDEGAERTARARDPAIIVAGEREAVAEVARAIQAQVDEMRRSLRTLTITIPRRQHAFLTGDAASQLLAATGCSIELPPRGSTDETVTIRGPQQQLPHALAATMERANAVRVEVVDLVAMHAAALAEREAALQHAKRLATWLAHGRVPRTPGVQVYLPRGAALDAAPAVHAEVVGEDAAAVANVRSTLEELLRPLSPGHVRVTQIDPLVHRHVIGRKGQGLRAHEARGVDVVMPPEAAPHADVLLVAARGASAEQLDSVEAELQRAAAAAADMHAVHLEVPARFHEALIGPERTTLNALMGEDRAVMVSLGSRRGGAADPTLGEDTVLLRGPREAVERAAEHVRRIAADAEQDSLVNGHTEQVEVAAAHVPHLIGRGGAGVARLREQLGVRVDVDDEQKGRRGDAPARITVTGRRECAQEAVARLLAQAQRLEDETTTVIRVPPEMHGALIGQRGKYVARLQDKYGVHIAFPPSGAERGTDEVSIRGGKQGVAQAKAELLELLQYEQERSHVAHMTVPQRALRRILGRGGSTINRIRAESEAQIDVDAGERAEGEGDAVIRLRGTQEAVDAARSALQAIFDEVQAEATITLSIPARFHGALIGARGQHLRDIVALAGGPEDPKEIAQIVHFPRAGQASDTVTVRARRELATRIAEQLQREADELAARIVLAAAVPPQLHRQLVSRGGSRSTEWARAHNATLFLPSWREYARLGEPANAAELQDAEPAHTIKVVGPQPGAEAVLREIEALLRADDARRSARANARIDDA